MSAGGTVQLIQDSFHKALLHVQCGSPCLMRYFSDQMRLFDVAVFEGETILTGMVRILKLLQFLASAAILEQLSHLL